MRLAIYLALLVLVSCTSAEQQEAKVIITGSTDEVVEFLSIGSDTIQVRNGLFADTLDLRQDQYAYLQLSTWKWPRIIYLKTGGPTKLNFKEEWINSEEDLFNEFLLNKDSILIPYSAKWNMTEAAFKAAWQEEFPVNLEKIDRFFEGSKTPAALIQELKQMEYMLRGHLTANFISYQERQDVEIDRSIYEFVEQIDLNEERLAFHVNNRNFQYYYYIDQVSESVPDSIYPFAAIDTVKKYVAIPDIRNMIIGNIVKSGLYEESVDHDALFEQYEENIGEATKETKIVELYEQIQRLQPGNPAPDFGRLTASEGNSVSIEDLRGKNILLSAWGTWCPYCKEELPYLKELIQKYPEQIESVAIALDKDVEKWKDYIAETAWQGQHLIDPKRNSTFRKNYLIAGTNIYYLIDKQGVILASRIKPSEEGLETMIQQLEK